MLGLRLQGVQAHRALLFVHGISLRLRRAHLHHRNRPPACGQRLCPQGDRGALLRQRRPAHERGRRLRHAPQQPVGQGLPQGAALPPCRKCCRPRPACDQRRHARARRLLLGLQHQLGLYHEARLRHAHDLPFRLVLCAGGRLHLLLSAARLQSPGGVPCSPRALAHPHRVLCGLQPPLCLAGGARRAGLLRLCLRLYGARGLHQRLPLHARHGVRPGHRRRGSRRVIPGALLRARWRAPFRQPGCSGGLWLQG